MMSKQARQMNLSKVRFNLDLLSSRLTSTSTSGGAIPRTATYCLCMLLRSRSVSTFFLTFIITVTWQLVNIKNHKQNFTNLRFSVSDWNDQLLTASQASIHSLQTSTGSDRKLIVACFEENENQEQNNRSLNKGGECDKLPENPPGKQYTGSWQHVYSCPFSPWRII